MKKQTLFLTITLIAILSVITGCGTPPPTYDETGYSGTYYGKHYLADSAFIRNIIGDPTATVIYDDTLIITNGTDATDGKVNAKSSLLGGGTIEIDVNSGTATPVFLGNIEVLGTTLKNTKLTSGKGTWNGDKTQLTTQLVANVTYNFNGTDIPLTGFKINGQFTKQ